MTDLAVGVVFTLFVLIVMSISEKIQKIRNRKKYTDEWFERNVDYNYLNRKDRIRKIMEE